MSMGLAPGGLMKQDIYEDPVRLRRLGPEPRGRCFVHIANSLMWQAITGTNPPTPPPTAKQYTDANLPWFDYYADKLKPVEGSGLLAKLKSVVTMGKSKGDVPLPENESVDPKQIVKYRAGLTPGQVARGGVLIESASGNAPGRIRTCDPRFRKPMLYPLSYGGSFAV